MPKARIAVVSPFVDKRHGTERCLAEELERLSQHYEIHLFSSRVEDLDLSGIRWHRVPEIPGPHLSKFLFWCTANHISRWSECRRSARPFDLVYSPGINCLDADVILVHHLFAEQLERVGKELRLTGNPPWIWPRLLHRRLYYQLLRRLERKIYSGNNVRLAAISMTMASDLERQFRPGERIPAIYHGVNTKVFNSDARLERRDAARNHFGFEPEETVLLLAGNDWAKKGLPCLIDALAEIRDLPVRALAAGGDEREPYLRLAQAAGVADRLRFVEPSPDVLQFFAAADLYVAPSVYDPFGLPVLEAMACGLPVIASRAMGASELVSEGEDGLILADPRDKTGLALLIRNLAADAQLRGRLGRNAVRTAERFTWDAHAGEMKQILEEGLAGKTSHACAVAP